MDSTHLVQFYRAMVSNIDDALNHGHKQTNVITMDFANAFDKVSQTVKKLDY